jgi:hypothetical protein
MQDLLTRIEKLRLEAVECDLIANLAIEPRKRAAFESLARALRREAESLVGVMASMSDRAADRE